MPRQCHSCHGYSDSYDEANLKRCSGCQKVYYCSASCQKNNWVYHIFDCKPRRPINTADYLALAVRQNLLPQHPQTCEDYGFGRAFTAEDKSKLLGLYIGLIDVLKVSPKTIHSWRTNGVLVEEIKATFYKVPERCRGGYFPWFLQNEHVLRGIPLSEDQLRNHGDAMILRAWRFTGGSETDSAEDARVAISHKSDAEQQCHVFYQLLLSKWHPCPSMDQWVAFGFAACESEEEEMHLGGCYQELINKCTFTEFCDAFRTYRLFDLLKSKELWVHTIQYLSDVLQGPMTKSVWTLKQYIFTEEEQAQMHPAVRVDYGFMNCRNDSEWRQLKRVYKAFFDTRDANPIALHEAAIKGKIYEFISGVVKGARNSKFQRLMKNLYPLPDV
ncbi:hypothetical protein HYDPIDRAFT_134545 [Hydnomerulius pinastri MD-312]|uniref:MYND-type domain-containing protein n=1 Tax=Hydnomerulius pinastri MD-312 TaxID=994086 RepID=A0A0C9W7U1_9AGAM|nr:hypothetical protein HYDPIDRAFT_134545 [Hydnomerulius pinastri MD-312]